jgi:hypothetical protein
MDKQNKYKLAKVGKITGSILFASILISSPLLGTARAFADTTPAAQTSSQPASSSSSASSTSSIPSADEWNKMSDAERDAALAKMTPEQKAALLQQAGVNVDNTTGVTGVNPDSSSDSSSSSSSQTDQTTGWHKDSSTGRYYEVFSDGTKTSSTYIKIATTIIDKNSGATLYTTDNYIDADSGQEATTVDYQEQQFDAKGYKFDSIKATQGTVYQFMNSNSLNYTIDVNLGATQGDVGVSVYLTKDGDTNPTNPTQNVDRSALEALLQKAEGYENDQKDYTLESRQALTDAITAANGVDQTPTSTQAEVDKATADLQKAVDAIEAQANLDKTALQQNIAKAQDLVKQTDTYTEVTISDLAQAIKRAQTMEDNANAVQADIDTSNADLVKYINALEKQAPKTNADKSGLENSIVGAQAKLDDGKTYTDDTVAAVKSALTKAFTVNDNNQATQDQVDSAKTALDNAVSALKVKDANPTPTPSTPDEGGTTTPAKVDKGKLQTEYNKAIQYKGADYTDASFSALQQKVSYALSVLGATDPSQSDIDKATAGLKSGVAGLVSATTNDKQDTPADNHANTDKDTKNVDKTTNSSKSVSDSSSESLNKKTQASEKAKVVTKSNDTKVTSAISNDIPSSSANENVPDVPKTLKNTSTAKLDSKAGSVIAAKSSQKVQEASLPQTGEDKQGSKAITLWGSVLLASTVAFFGFGYMRKYKHFNK